MSETYNNQYIIGHIMSFFVYYSFSSSLSQWKKVEQLIHLKQATSRMSFSNEIAHRKIMKNFFKSSTFAKHANQERMPTIYRIFSLKQ